MDTKVAVTVDTGIDKYPVVKAVFFGVQIERYWDTPNFKKFINQAIAVGDTKKDMFDFGNYLFSQVENLTQRQYGSSIKLESIELSNSELSIISFRR